VTKLQFFSAALFISFMMCSGEPVSDTGNAGVPVITSFGPPPAMPGAPPPVVMDIPELQKVLSDIGVDKPRSQKIISIARNFIAGLDEQLIKIQREELNIKEELLKQQPNLETIKGMINKKSNLFAGIEFMQIKRDLDIKAILTQDEYDKWKSVTIHKMNRMRMRMMDGMMPGKRFDKQDIDK
jgi:hypothetical protein